MFKRNDELKLLQWVEKDRNFILKNIGDNKKLPVGLSQLEGGMLYLIRQSINWFIYEL